MQLPHIKCAAGTLRAYLRRCTDDAKASFVSSRSLSVRGSWGTAPSVFWYGVPGGTQGPLGKGGAAERWRVAYPIGIATRHGAKPATTHTSKRNAPAASRMDRCPPVTPRRRQATINDPRRVGVLTKPCKRREEINAIVSAGNPSGSFHSPPPFAQGRLSPLGDYKLSPAGQACSLSFAKSPAPPPGDRQLALNKILLLLFLTEK